MMAQGALDLVGNACDGDRTDRPRTSLQRMSSIDPAGQLGVAGDNGGELSALLAKQRKDLALQLGIAESLPRQMLKVERAFGERTIGKRLWIYGLHR